jgi:hypothetical protein
MITGGSLVKNIDKHIWTFAKYLHLQLKMLAYYPFKGRLVPC